MLFGSALRRSRVMRRRAVSAMSVSSARRAVSAYSSKGRLMNTATPLAMIAVIAMTMTISISVTPLCRLLDGLRQSIGRVAHSVAVELNDRVGWPGHRDRDEQCLGGGDGA